MYLCECCAFKTESKQNFINHFKTKKHRKKLENISNGQTPKYQCKKCHKSFSFASGLSKHKKQCVETTGNTSLPTFESLETITSMSTTLENRVISNDEAFTIGSLKTIMKEVDDLKGICEANSNKHCSHQ